MPGSLWTLLVCSILSVDFFYYFIGRWTIHMYGHDFFHPSFLAAWALVQTFQAYETLYGIFFPLHRHNPLLRKSFWLFSEL